MNRFEAINCMSYQIGNLKALMAAHAEVESRRQGKAHPESELYGLFSTMLDGSRAVKDFIANEALDTGEKTGNCARCGRYFRILPFNGYCGDCLNHGMMLLGKRDAEFIQGEETKEENEEDDE